MTSFEPYPGSYTAASHQLNHFHHFSAESGMYYFRRGALTALIIIFEILSFTDFYINVLFIYTDASHIAIKLSVGRYRSQGHTAHHPSAEPAQADKNPKILPHCGPESKCVECLITVKTIRCCPIIVGLIDGEDPNITCRCTGQEQSDVPLVCE